MKKTIIVLMLVLISVSAVFASRTIYGFYASPYSVQSSKGLADSSKKSSVYGLAAKASYFHVFDAKTFNWGIGAEASLSNYFYTKADNFDVFNLFGQVVGGVNFIDNEKVYAGLDLGFGANCNIAFGGKTVTFPALSFKIKGVQHLFDNVSAGVHFEGVVSFKQKASNAFEFKTFAGIEYSF